ncbi:MAG TPA: response regulator transcription factor [Actinomycetota bacterium]|nr:response regulator transcription factor [Actinomycetota bacterium]
MSGVDVDGSRRTIKVMLVDDHVMFAETLVRVLKDEPDLDVVATASSVAEGRSRARIYKPDVVLMDQRLPDGLGTEAARLIRGDRPETKVVMLTGFPEDSVLLTAIEVGCSGYMTKDSVVQEAISAVRAAAAGEALISPTMLARLLPRLRRDADRGSYALSSRELDVLQLMAEGLPNGAIADRLVVSINTVRKHVQSILSKLGAHSKLEALSIAVRHRLVDMAVSKQPSRP